jgi:hypothetical protein
MSKYTFGSQREDEDGNIIINQKTFTDADERHNIKFSLYTQGDDGILKGKSVTIKDTMPTVNKTAPQTDEIPPPKTSSGVPDAWKGFYKDDIPVVKTEEKIEETISLSDKVENDILGFFELPNYLIYGFLGLTVFVIYNDLIE